MAIVKGVLIPIVFGIGILLMTLVLGFEMIIFNEPYFEWHYENRSITETTDMDIENLMYVTREMLDYLKGDRENLDMEAIIDGEMQEVFGQREKDHMVDVQLLYFGARNIRRLGMLLICAVLLTGVVLKKDILVLALRRVKFVIAGLIGILLVVGGLFALDFERYFTLFHEMFFSNDLWILNPRTDIMINMVPYSYFYSIVMIGTLLCMLMIVIAVVGCEILGKRLDRTLMKA